MSFDIFSEKIQVYVTLPDTINTSVSILQRI